MSSLYERAAIIPGRSMTRSKAPGRFFPDPAMEPQYCNRGEGAKLYCTNGREYIDMLCGLGAISLGYGIGPKGTLPHVDDDAYWKLASGVYSLPHVGEIEAAEAVQRHIATWATAVRFVKTGSEATHAAYLVAKRATGRTRVVRGKWSYHGWHEWIEQAKTIGYGDNPEAYEWSDVAALFIEPHRWKPIDVEWLKSLRACCDRNGVLLVFDEMIFGGRWALGGASELFKVEPDLACYGKAFGNGEAVAFVAGKDVLVEHGEVVSGTFSGDVTGLRAFLWTLKFYREHDVIGTMWKRGRMLRWGLDWALREHQACRAHTEGEPVHQRIVFENSSLGKEFSALMAARGVLWHPDCTNIMYSHTPELIEQVIDAAYQSVKAISEESCRRTA